MDLYAIRRDIINRVIGIEGAFVNDSRDSGGATKYGITAETARKHGISDVSSITVEQAFGIYITGYWNVLMLDQIAALSPEIAEELFEQGVNMGNSVPAEWLQRMLNTLNLNGRRFADVTPDGNIGEATVAALGAYLRWRGKKGESVIVRGLNAYQSTFYFDLAGRRPKDEAFAHGWQANRVAETAVDQSEIMSRPAADAPLPMPAPDLPPLYYITDSNGETQGVWDKALPDGKPDGYIIEAGIKYPIYEYKPPKPPLVSTETVIDSSIHGGLLSIASAGLAAVFGFDLGISPDTGAAIAAGGGIGSLLTFGIKRAVKWAMGNAVELVATKMQERIL
ncbi:glycosyl hydrolase 108 family protein [Thiothrix sp.]|jgi:lysozyme family protein|uniref:glycoside hydrolase family 108 protein n=1 Tax=Thiothrix sp. TaxID=1032 RepID=UPI00257F6023|nr:glycosyl hydrolase 108 family protein [Thiothrix sp.]